MPVLEGCSSDKEFNLIDTIRLIRSENVGAVTFYQLLKLYNNPTLAIKNIPNLAKNAGKKTINICSEQEVIKELALVDNFGSKIITIFDKEYPQLLKKIYDPPPVITVKGNLELLQKKSISIVGSRNASANGCRFAYKIAKELGDNGIVVVSGLARGIDFAAHKGSIKAGTIAVIAGGIDNKYPPENEDLYDEISKEGLIITEYPFGSIPRSQNFPRRNRIISGISSGTLLVEATLKSGSLITARCALEQNREIFAVPGFPLDPRNNGTNKLLKEGAILVESADDILDVLNTNYQKININLTEYEHSFFDKQQVISDDDLAKARKILLGKLSFDPITIEEIVEITGIGYRIIVTVLLELELAGKLLRYPGDKVSLIFEDA